jgi:hypothetical protein
MANPVTLFADVTASFADVKGSLVGKSAIQLGPDQSMPTIQSSADTQALLPTATVAPTRDETAAFGPAGQSQTDNSEPPSQALGQFKAWAAEKDAQAQEGPVERVQDDAPIQNAQFRQFEAWAVQKDAQAQGGPLQPVQDAPAPVVQNASAQAAKNAQASLRPVQKLRPVHNALAETGPVHNPSKKVRRQLNARVQVRPAQDARAQQ